jgi:hypothetical protein
VKLSRWLPRGAGLPAHRQPGVAGRAFHMCELVVRAHLHRSRLGDRTALAAARLLGRDIDNLSDRDADSLTRRA